MVKYMSLRFIYGKSGTGKTTYCFNQIKELINTHQKVYIITPEQFSFTAENNLMNSCERKAVINAEVITFERMAHRILVEVGGIINNSISNATKPEDIADIISRAEDVDEAKKLVRDAAKQGNKVAASYIESQDTKNSVLDAMANIDGVSEGDLEMASQVIDNLQLADASLQSTSIETIEDIARSLGIPE